MFSTLFMGLCYYVVPRLCGIRVWQEKLGYWLAWTWNLGLVLGMILLALGYSQGLEAGEMPLIADIIFFVCMTLATIQFDKFKLQNELYLFKFIKDDGEEIMNNNYIGYNGKYIINIDSEKFSSYLL